MKTFICVLALLASTLAWADFVPGGNPCQGTEGTLKSVSGQTSGTVLAQIIPAVSGSQIFICSLNVQGVSGTTPTFSLSYGTGSNCATGSTSIVSAFSTPANTLLNFSTPIARVPVSQALCYLDGGTTPVQNYLITYIQK